MKLRRAAAFFLVLVLLCPMFALPARASAADSTPMIALRTSVGDRGVSVTVTVQDCTDISAVFFSFGYDSSALTLCDAEGTPTADADAISPAPQLKLLDLRIDEHAGLVGAELLAYPNIIRTKGEEQVVATLYFLKKQGRYDDFTLCTSEDNRSFLSSFTTDYGGMGGCVLKTSLDKFTVNDGTLAFLIDPPVDEPDTTAAEDAQTTTGAMTTTTEASAPDTTTTDTTTSTQPDAQPEGDMTEIIRIGGLSRLETAVLVSQKGWYCSDTVILANATGFQDALVGVPLAAAYDAPILLTTGRMPEAILLAELRRLGAQNIYILGGQTAVSVYEENALRANGMNVMRICGDNRFSTAVEAAKLLKMKLPNGFSELIFLNAESYADALAISAIAAINGCPILYAPLKGTLSYETTEFIKSAGCSKAVVIGSSGSVSDEAFAAIEACGLDCTRVYGSDRYGTALEIYSRYESSLTGKGVLLATGENFPDALSGAALAARQKLPVVLVGDNISAKLRLWFINHEPEYAYILGGRDALTDDTVNTLLGLRP
ncbi:MAG: cell wall-binding repeat-containing protein [Ruminococcaceae bacterium]|nr:cell wall-binding repeat-containing protein [Oscillospiraceae bacterium]